MSEYEDGEALFHEVARVARQVYATPPQKKRDSEVERFADEVGAWLVLADDGSLRLILGEEEARALMKRLPPR